MTLVQDLELAELNPFDDVERAAFADRVDEMHEQGEWLFKTPLWYSVIDHDAVRELQRDPRLHTWGAQLFEMQGVSGGPAYETFARTILSLEGEAHTRLRRLVSRAFTPRSTDRIRPMMFRYVDERAAAIAERGGGDFMAELGESYPIAVVCELIGVPFEDWERFSAWAEDAFKIFNFKLTEELPIIEAALSDLQDYLGRLLEARRANPGDDLLSELLAIEDEGDRLTRQELTDLVATILLAGTDTTRNQLGVAMMLFGSRPDQWARLVADPSLIPAAVEEVLRFDPAVGGTPRITTEDVEYRGVTFPKGTMLLLSTASANRDPDVVRCPMDFDPAADRGGWGQITFGSGPHYCLGANLARAELQEALAALVKRFASFELAGEPVMNPNFVIYGPRGLPITVTPATEPQRAPVGAL